MRVYQGLIWWFMVSIFLTNHIMFYISTLFWVNFIQHNVIFFCRFIARASDWRSLSQENWPTTGHCRNETYRWSRAHNTDVCLAYFTLITYALYSSCTLDRGMNIRTKFSGCTSNLVLAQVGVRWTCTEYSHKHYRPENTVSLHVRHPKSSPCGIFAQLEIFITQNINIRSHTNTYRPCKMS